jgi:hypothetical protein
VPEEELTMPDLTVLRDVPLDALRRRLVELSEEQRITRAVLTQRVRIERERERRAERQSDHQAVAATA